MKRVPRLTLTIALILVGLPPTGAAAVGTQAVPSLWIVDDTTRTAYQVSPGGDLGLSFDLPNGATSSIAIDPSNGTLWGANEGRSEPTRPGKLVNYDRTGTVLAEIQASAFGAVGVEGLAVSADPLSDSFWVVDDPLNDVPNRVTMVYNISRSGDLLTSFPTATFDDDSTSPQAIAVDPFDGTLWITDNSTRRVYNITRTGQLLNEIRTVEFDAAILNGLQGVTVESPEILWVTTRTTGKVYRLSTDGELIASFETAIFDPASNNPTGIAFEGAGAVTLLGADDYALFALSGAKLKIEDNLQGAVGDAALAPATVAEFKGGFVSGQLAVDPTLTSPQTSNVIIGGGIAPTDLSGLAADAVDASALAATLAPTQQFSEIKSTMTIVGTPGLNVVKTKKIELKDGATLTLSGDATTRFVVNIAESLKLENGSSIQLVGVAPTNVLFNLVGDNDSEIKSGSVMSGTIIAPSAKITIKDPGTVVTGSVIGGEELVVKDDGRVRSFLNLLPPGDMGSTPDFALFAVAGKLKIEDDASSVLGDVGLGIRAKQEFSEGFIGGDFLVDPSADNQRDHNVEIAGTTTLTSLLSEAADAVDASALAATLAPTQQFSEIKSTMTIVGTPGLNVVKTKKIELKDGATLTLSGDATTRFVVNIAESLKLENGSSIQLVGVASTNVLFNLVGDNDSEIKSGSVMSGTIIAPSAKITIKDPGTVVTGSVIGGEELVVKDDGRVENLA